MRSLQMLTGARVAFGTWVATAYGNGTLGRSETPRPTMVNVRT
jgi:hypothetical protein